MSARYGWLYSGFLMLAACTQQAGETAFVRAALQGPWQMPDEVAQVAAEQYVAYEPTPPYRSGAGCLENGRLMPGIGRLSDYAMKHFDGVTHVWDEVYCKASGGVMSQHGMGKATDLMITPISGDADNERGDRVANWLAVNAQQLGVMRIIWDDASWTAERGTTNTGNFGHQDHIHVELTDDGAQGRAPWFAEGRDQQPPSLDAARAWGAEFVSLNGGQHRGLWLEEPPGMRVPLTVSFRNVGSRAWDAGGVQLAALDPRDHPRTELMTERWLTASRIATLAQHVASGEIGRFDFDVTVPDATTDLYLGLVAEQQPAPVWFSGFGGPERHDSLFVVLEPKPSDQTQGCRIHRGRFAVPSAVLVVFAMLMLMSGRSRKR